MHFQFLIEDQSSAKLINELMQKIARKNTQITYNYKSFRGIGGFTKKNTIKETRTGKLLNDLATYLRGFNKSLQGFPSAIFIILDNDDYDTMAFYAKLEQVTADNNIIIDHVYCIAVEEVEAWLLGDEAALLAAYPQAKQSVLRSYVQDSICGTWQKLADVIYPGGLMRLKKDCPSYMEIGKKKAEWAKNIGVHMNLNLNKSPSFNYFITELYKRIDPIA
ncbi:MAG: hypothetical protein VB070_10990 [Clostridiaceae bacterium]|nr:hypothetical protein [Clostridiaceae bacterium]